MRGSLDSLFYRVVLISFSASSTSYLTQFDGLYSSAGLEPAPPQPFALGLSLAPWLGLSLDDTARLLALLGAAIPLLAAATGALPAPALALALATHLSLLERGSTFTNFQWDILLAEAGWVALLLAASAGAPHARLLARFAAFKLLLMSGAVKLQAGCPTWEGLTALDVHFASQPLPTPVAWAAHSLLPPALGAAGVAATLWAETVGAALLLSPWAPAAALGVASNAALQLLIMLSGNYNYFNALTLALLLPCLPPGARGPARPWGRAALLPALALLAAVAATCCALFSLTLRPERVTVPATAAALAAAREGWGAGGGAPGGGPQHG